METETLEQLFDGRSQLVVYHAMFDPKTVTSKMRPYTEHAPCSACSFWMDIFERVVIHLAHRHYPMLERPAEFNEAVLRVVTELTSQALT